MALDLETLNQQLDDLRKNRAMAVNRVVIGGDGTTEIAYRTDAELAAAEASLVARIATLTGATVTEIRVTATKGLES